MTFRQTLLQLDRLTDERLIVTLRDAIEATRCRPRLKTELRRLLADVLSEIKAEMICSSNLTPEQIAAESIVAAGAHIVLRAPTTPVPVASAGALQ